MSKFVFDMPTAGAPASLPDTDVSQRTKYVGLLAVALAVQLALLWISMPLGDLFSGNWFFHIDNPFHIYQLELGRALQAEGRLMGYDPFFGAGHLAGLSSNVSARFTLVIAALLPASVPVATVYAIYVLACSLVAPLSLWGLGQLLSWSYWHRVSAIAIGLLLWWVGVFHWYHTAGMVSFVCACYVAPVYAVWVYALCDSRTVGRPVSLLLAGLVGGLCMWLHPLFCIPVITLCLCFVLFSGQRPRLLPLMGRATAISALVVLACLPWVIALTKTASQVSDDHGYQRAVGIAFLFNSMGVGTGGALGATINLVLIGICSVGVWSGLAGKKSFVHAFLLAGLVLLMFASFAGNSSTLAFVQPNRFLGPAYLLIGMAAAFHSVALAACVRINCSRPVWVGLLTFFGLILIFFGRELVRELTPGAHQHHGKAPPEISAPPMLVKQVESWITTNTGTDGRILFEASLGRVHGGGHIAGYLASKTKREFMGASYPYFLPRLSCWDKTCLNRPLGKMTGEFFGSAIETYNVGWIIAHSAELKSFLTQMPAIKWVVSYGEISIYEVAGARSYVHTGNARVVSRDFNQVNVRDAVGNSLTLRYNWVNGLETVPASVIEAYQWSPDFPPLIRIRNPPTNFVLRLAD